MRASVFQSSRYVFLVFLRQLTHLITEPHQGVNFLFVCFVGGVQTFFKVCPIPSGLVPTDARHFYIVHWLASNNASRCEFFLSTSVLPCIFQEKNAL
jgi:hypothetical protein